MPKDKKLTGSFNDYYVVKVDYCQRNPDRAPYEVEAQDLIRALDLSFDEGNIMKELIRSANARKGNGKFGHKEIYGREKILHSAKALLDMSRLESSEDINE